MRWEEAALALLFTQSVQSSYLRSFDWRLINTLLINKNRNKTTRRNSMLPQNFEKKKRKKVDVCPGACPLSSVRPSRTDSTCTDTSLHRLSEHEHSAHSETGGAVAPPRRLLEWGSSPNMVTEGRGQSCATTSVSLRRTKAFMRCETTIVLSKNNVLFMSKLGLQWLII